MYTHTSMHDITSEEWLNLYKGYEFVRQKDWCQGNCISRQTKREIGLTFQCLTRDEKKKNLVVLFFFFGTNLEQNPNKKSKCLNNQVGLGLLTWMIGATQSFYLPFSYLSLYLTK